MQMGYGLFQEQSMKLVMTPELRQAITILQLSALDLVEYVNQQLIENPVIEPIHTETMSHLIKPRNSIRQNGSEYNPLDLLIKNDITLEKHLLEQLSYLNKPNPEIERIAKYIIGNLNDMGYLDLAMEQIAESLHVPVGEVGKALSVVQRLEPPGVGARSLQECLMIQLEYQGLGDSLCSRIVKNHLSDLAEGKINKIATEMKATPCRVQEAIDLIRTLNPRPGGSYQRDETGYIIPDVTVECVEGRYIVLVNDSIIPQIRLNPLYQRLLHEGNDVKKYVHEKMNDAHWLIRGLEQRAVTLFRVTEAIVNEQRNFLEHGIEDLKPMTLKEIAELVGLHESTVSRATNHKYIHTPRGTFELKYFFSQRLSTFSGDSASSKSVKKQLKHLIQEEDRKKPLSDQQLSDILNHQGICISRRTVAKYREEMGIQSTAKRKRYV